jgi:hypothetical protein
MVELYKPQYKMDSFGGVFPFEREYLPNYSQQSILALAYLKSIRRRVVGNGFTYLASFDGKHRSSKSTTAITFAYLWDPTFWDYFESRIVQDHIEFVNAMEQISKLKIKGGCIIVDEAGVSMSSSDWYERWMKTITKMVQMFGYLYPIVLFVAPVKDFVDSRLRRMFHAYYHVERYDKLKSYVTPYNVRFNAILGKWFYKKPRMRIGSQEIIVRRIVIHKPPAFIIERYQQLELNRKDKMFKGFLEELKTEEVKEAKKEVDLDDVVEFVIKNYKNYESKRSLPQLIQLDSTRLEFGLKLRQREAMFVRAEAEQVLNKDRTAIVNIQKEDLGIAPVEPKKVDDLKKIKMTKFEEEMRQDGNNEENES